MPEGYTHARTALRAAELAEYAPSSREAFIAGANGPDSLFGFEAWKPSASRSMNLPTLGNRMHRERTGAFLQYLIQHAVTPAQKDYALGFLNHYATDGICHPYVYAAMAQGRPYHCKAGHGYFECALDSWLHKRDFGTATVQAKHSNPRLLGVPKAECVALLHDGLRGVYGVEVPHEKLSDSFEHMYFIRLLTVSPLGLKKALFWLVEPFMGGRGAITAHCSPRKLKGLKPGEKQRLPSPWQDPFTGEVHEEDLDGMLERAAQRGAAYIIAAQQFWAGEISAKRIEHVVGARSYNNGTETALSALAAVGEETTELSYEKG